MIIPANLVPGKVQLPVYHAPGKEALQAMGYDLQQFALPDHWAYCALDKCRETWGVFNLSWFQFGRHWKVSHNWYVCIGLCPLQTSAGMCTFQTKMVDHVGGYLKKGHVTTRHREQTCAVLDKMIERIRSQSIGDWKRILHWPSMVCKNMRKFLSHEIPTWYTTPTGLHVIAREPYDEVNQCANINVQDTLCVNKTVPEWSQSLTSALGNVLEEMEGHAVTPQLRMACLTKALCRLEQPTLPLFLWLFNLLAVR